MNVPQLRVSHLSDDRQKVSAINGALRKTDAFDLSADQLTVTVDRDVDIDGVLKLAGVQAVGAPDTGWVADTGTALKTTVATYTAPTISNPPTQAEVQAIANALQSATQQVKALKDALLAHGLIVA